MTLRSAPCGPAGAFPLCRRRKTTSDAASARRLATLQSEKSGPDKRVACSNWEFDDMVSLRPNAGDSLKEGAGMNAGLSDRQPPADIGQNTHVLVADDDPVCRLMLETTLQMA